MTTQTQTQTIALTIRCRAFGGQLGTHRVELRPDGDVAVYDRLAGYYTTCHSLSARDLGRIRRAAATV